MIFRPSRRDFLRILGASAGYVGLKGLGFAQASSEYPFAEVAPEKSGIHWVHTAGHSQQKYLPETTGAGCAFLDYDNDGWMDIYLVNSGKCDFYTPAKPLRNALYKNNRDGTFTDVTEKAGVGAGGYGQGVAVGDYDGDGLPDLYVTQYGRSILYHNNGDGTFTDVTEKAGVAAPGWASSAVWFDYDNDGRLDLFVCRFVDFDKDKNLPCTADGKPGYCVPKLYKPMASYLFHNNGDGTFTDVSRESGIGKYLGKAWGAVAADINNDGNLDLFVANDTVANFLYANRGKGKFEEIGTMAGVAYSDAGRPRSGMGVDAADVDQDGWIDLFVANIDHERYSLYRNNHDETFDDVADKDGIGMATRLMSGWGLKFFDYDNDGNLDLIVCNGNPDDLIQAYHQDVTYQEPLLLFHNNGKSFDDVSAQSGPIFQRKMSARGLALGDFNNDGAVDVLISVNDGAPVLLHNGVGSRNHWVGVRLKGKKANPDAIGAKITYQAGDLRRMRTVVGGGSFMSAQDPRLVLGIGARTKMDWVEVQWPQPSGRRERFESLAMDRYVTLEEGQGKSVAP